MSRLVQKHTQQTQQLEGKRSKWKLFARARNGSTDALPELSQALNESVPQQQDNRKSVATQNSTTTNVSVTSSKDSCDKTSAISGHCIDSSRHISPATNGSLTKTFAVAPDVGYPGQMLPQVTTAPSSTNPPVQQELFVDPVTGDMTTRTIITTVVTTVVNKSQFPPSRPSLQLDIEEERRLASEYLAARALNEHGPGGLHPAPKSTNRDMKRLAQGQNGPELGQAKAASERPREDGPLSNGSGVSAYGQPHHRHLHEEVCAPESDRFEVLVSRLGEGRSKQHKPSGNKIALQSKFTDQQTPASEQSPIRIETNGTIPSHNQLIQPSIEKSKRSSLERSHYLPDIHESMPAEAAAENRNNRSKPKRLSAHARVRETGVVFPPTPPIEPQEKRDRHVERDLHDQVREDHMNHEDQEDNSASRRSSGTFGEDGGRERGASRARDRNNLVTGTNPLASHPVNGTATNLF